MPDLDAIRQNAGIAFRPPPREQLLEAAAIIRSGGIVAFPTETYYGLAADPFAPAALEKIFRIKKRSLTKPLMTLVSSTDQVNLLAAKIPREFEMLINRFWPGPLTLIFPARPSLPVLLTCNSGTVGIRISSHPWARMLTEITGQPITATSANISGHQPAATAENVYQQLGRRVDLIIDGGPTPGRLSSTLIALLAGELRIIREGALPAQQILDFLQTTQRCGQSPAITVK